MLILNIPDSDETLEWRLRRSANANGRSIDEEARRIIEEALSTVAAPASLANEIRDLFAPFGGVELDIPERHRRSREPPSFD